MAIRTAKARIAPFQQIAHPARGRVIVVTLEDLSKRCAALLVTVAEIVPDDLHPAAIHLHPCGKAPHPHLPIIALLARQRHRRPLEIALPLTIRRIVGTADAEHLAPFVRELRPAVPRTPIPLPIRPAKHTVQ